MTQHNATPQTTGKFILNSGIMQHTIEIPEGGLQICLTVEKGRLKASFAQGSAQKGLEPITWALEKLHIDQIVDPAEPYAAYDPGYRGSAFQHPEKSAPVKTERAEVG